MVLFAVLTSCMILDPIERDGSGFQFLEDFVSRWPENAVALHRPFFRLLPWPRRCNSGCLDSWRNRPLSAISSRNSKWLSLITLRGESLSNVEHGCRGRALASQTNGRGYPNGIAGSDNIGCPSLEWGSSYPRSLEMHQSGYPFAPVSPPQSPSTPWLERPSNVVYGREVVKRVKNLRGWFSNAQ